MKKLLLALMVAGVVSSIVAEEPQDRAFVTIEITGDNAVVTVGGDEVYGEATNAKELKNDNSYTDASFVDASADTETVTITAPEAGLSTEEAAV